MQSDVPGQPPKFDGAGEFGVVAVTARVEPVDPDSDTARLARHRAYHSAWPNGRPETHAERRLREALDHLERVLNGCRSAAEQLEADTKAREFLADCGR